LTSVPPTKGKTKNMSLEIVKQLNSKTFNPNAYPAKNKGYKKLISKLQKYFGKYQI
jgi:hypothetical protein